MTFCRKIFRPKLWPKKSSANISYWFLMDIFGRKNLRDRIVTDEIRWKNTPTEFLTDFSVTKSVKCGKKLWKIFWLKVSKIGHKFGHKLWSSVCRSQFLIQKNQWNSWNNILVTNSSQFVNNYISVKKKSMKSVKKHYSHNFEKSITNSITNCMWLITYQSQFSVRKNNLFCSNYNSIY